MHCRKPKKVFQSSCFQGWKRRPPPMIPINIRSLTTKSIENVKVELKSSTAVQHYEKNYGFFLSDYVNSGQLDIDMAKNIHGKKRFSYDNEGIPEELQKIRKEKGSNILTDELETLLTFVLELEKFKEGAISRKDIDGFTRRMLGRAFSNMSYETLEYDIANFNLESLVAFDPKQSFICQVLKNHEYSLDDLTMWKQAAAAPRTTDVFEIMSKVYFSHWPRFLALFTLKRRCDSRQSAYKCIQLYQHKFNDFGREWQVGAYIRILRICQNHLVQYLPIITRTFVVHADNTLKNGFTYNQLLWLLAHFGTSWSNDNAKIIIESQRYIVLDLAKHGCEIDTKGYLALAYAAKDLYPERSRDIVELVKRHDYTFSEEELYIVKNEKTTARAKFPYTKAVYAMDILLTKDYTEAINLLLKFPADVRQTGGIWGILLMHIYHLNQLTGFITEAIWTKIREQKIKLTSFLIQKLILGMKSNKMNLQVLEEAEKQGLKHVVNSQNIRFFFSAQSEEELIKARILLSHVSNVSIHVYDKVIRAEKRFQPGSMWKTYATILNNKLEPTETTLKTMCMAASDNLLLFWDGMYATQRCVVEFKNWVRGAEETVEDINHPFKLYPSTGLFYEYVKMLGKANYQVELRGILPWMARINFKPNKLILCAIIVYSREGRFLKKHAEKVGGEWPTENEIEQYLMYNVRNEVKENKQLKSDE